MAAFGSQIIEAELKCCPFCAGPANLLYHPGDERISQTWCVECPNCEFSTKKQWGSSTWSRDKRKDDNAKNTAIALWNRRHTGDSNG